MSLQIPARRSRRLQHREENVQQPEQPIETTYSAIPTKQKPLQTLVLNKRRRIGNRERDLELEAVRCFVLYFFFFTHFFNYTKRAIEYFIFILRL